MKKLIGVLLLPFLYNGIFPLMLVPYLFTVEDIGIVFFGVFCIYMLHTAIFGLLGGMSTLTWMIISIFNIKYTTTGQWTSPMMHSFSIWEYPILEVNNKKYNLSIAKYGGNLYDYEVNIQRCAIYYYFFD